MSDSRATPALLQLLRELPASLEVHRIDRVWLFAPREVGGRESGLVVLSLLPPEPGEQRRLLTLRYQAERVRGATRLETVLTEQGSAPAERIPRLIEGVLARLGDAREDPLERAVEGNAARWADLLAALGAAPPEVDPANGE